MSRKLFSECRNKTLELKGWKPRYFIIKSCNKEKVLSSMRENVWSSTTEGNIRLNAAYNDQERKGPVYLFFSVNKSKCFCGVAKMFSPVDYKTRWSQWKQNNGRWQECFDVRWIIVKNIPNDNLRNLSIKQNSKTFPVTFSQDTQELSLENGTKMMEIFQDVII
ncbi:YTHDF [Mytilus edulis]|uniref:YTHDF n=1 Tax=Mytilus edulis TaxID=6550 RepID=A0A8S3RSN5_MYTED|nr:YTHDF [Mytilus edulis]